MPSYSFTHASYSVGKAPSVSDRPRACVNADIDRTVSSVMARKEVWSFAEATSLNARFKKRRPAIDIILSAAAALTAAERSATPAILGQ